MRTLAQCGLAFKGSNEKSGSPNNGNFVALIELIPKFDMFLANHIKLYRNTNSGSRMTSSLSKRICNELVQFMNKKMTESVLNDLRETGYFTFSVDSPTDLYMQINFYCKICDTQ